MGLSSKLIPPHWFQWFRFIVSYGPMEVFTNMATNLPGDKKSNKKWSLYRTIAQKCVGRAGKLHFCNLRRVLSLLTPTWEELVRNRYCKFIIIVDHICTAILHHNCGSEGVTNTQFSFWNAPFTPAMLSSEKILDVICCQKSPRCLPAGGWSGAS